MLWHKIRKTETRRNDSSDLYGRNRAALEVERLCPVKVRKSLWWEIQKKLNSFGSVSLLAFSVRLGFLLEHAPASPILAVWTINLATWGIWSVLTSSTYKASSET
jgi:hypothetical protein